MENQMEKEKVVEILKSIGMSKNEVEVYLSLLYKGISTALDISKDTKIHRSNVYDSLRSLIDKGFIINTIVKNKKTFQAIDPEKIKNYIKQKEMEFDTILPNLKRFQSLEQSNSDIFMSQGVFSARQALVELLDCNSPIYVYGASKEAVDNLGIGFLKEFHNKRIKKKVPMLHIYSKKALDRIKNLNKMKYTEARFMPKKYDTVASTVICKDRVLLNIFSKPVIVIKINNKEVAEAYKQYFNVLWHNARL